MSLTSWLSSRNRNKYGGIWKQSINFFKGCSPCYYDAIYRRVLLFVCSMNHIPPYLFLSREDDDDVRRRHRKTRFFTLCRQSGQPRSQGVVPGDGHSQSKRKKKQNKSIVNYLVHVELFPLDWLGWISKCIRRTGIDHEIFENCRQTSLKNCAECFPDTKEPINVRGRVRDLSHYSSALACHSSAFARLRMDTLITKLLQMTVKFECWQCQNRDACKCA